MKTVVKVKLISTLEQKQMLKDTMIVFNNACNEISQIARNKGITSKYDLQKLVYHPIKKKYKLTAQAVIRAIAKVVEAYKRDRTKLCTFKSSGAMVYDQRILRFKGFDFVNLWTMNGRQDIAMQLGDYQKEKFANAKGQVDLIITKNIYYLVVTIETPEETPIEINDYLGVDLGVYNIATDSTGDKFSGKKVEAVRRAYKKRRSSLQSKGTRSAKRRLKKISGKESRFKRDINHCISKKIVEKAKGTCSAIVLENLQGISGKKNMKRLGKNLRSMISSWSFFQLQNFIEYKALLSGVSVVRVSPKNTSRECNICGHTDKDNRKTQEAFLCLDCGHREHADSNAAKTIRNRAFVKKPIVTDNLVA